MPSSPKPGNCWGEDETAERELAEALADYDALIEQMPERANRLHAEREFLSVIHARERGELEAHPASLLAAAWWVRHSADLQGLEPLQQTAVDLLQGVTDEDAVTFFTELINESPDSQGPFQERAAAYARLGRFDEAADDALRVLELAPDDQASGAAARPEYQWLMKWDEVFDRVADRRSDDNKLWVERGRYFAWRNQWRRAAEQYRDVPVGEPPHREYACALLLSADDEGYHALCERLLERIPDISNPAGVLSYTLTCCLGPHPTIDEDRLLAAAERFDPPRPWELVDHALVHLRAGRIEQAVRYAEESESPSRKHHRSFVLALAHHALGHDEQGRQAYQAGLNGFEQLAEPDTDSPGRTHIQNSDPHMWLWLNVLRREAIRAFDPPRYQEELAAEYPRGKSWSNRNPISNRAFP